jgi:hypothetical protein
MSGSAAGACLCSTPAPATLRQRRTLVASLLIPDFGRFDASLRLTSCTSSERRFSLLIQMFTPVAYEEVMSLAYVVFICVVDRAVHRS